MKRNIFYGRLGLRTLTAVVVLGLVLSGQFSPISVALASQDVEHEKVTVCHALGNGGFQEADVDRNAWDEHTSGHSDHEDDFLMTGESCVPPLSPFCGDSVVNQVGEECDGDAGVTAGNYCDSGCLLQPLVPICGNSVIDNGEQCDDGNVVNGDGCSGICQNEISAEPFCGDGQVNQAGEQCDGSTGVTEGYVCDSGCLLQPLPMCGNDAIEAGEQCDDANTLNGDGCSATCQNESNTEPFCGDSVVNQVGEECDGDAGVTAGHYCDSGCILKPVAVCGNETIEQGEQCDDGNTTNNDGCSAACQIEHGSSICGVKFSDHNGNGIQNSGDQNLTNWTIKLLTIGSCQLNDEWADVVVSTVQGTRKDGSAVNADRSTPSTVLGSAQYSNASDTFYSLGFGNTTSTGVLVIKFNNLVLAGPGNDLDLIEATFEPYPEERVDVYGSQDGTTWTYLGNYNKDSQVDLNTVAPGLAWISYVKVVDTTNPAVHANDADGFDVDGARALNCGQWQTVQVTTTTENGYCFDDVSDGDYYVTEMLQQGWVNTTPLYQPAEIDSEHQSIVVDFGNTTTEIEIPTSSICGYKFNDLNHDGQFELSEAGLPNWSIAAQQADNSPIVAQTASDGSYCFFDLKPGEWTVSEQSQIGWTNSTPTSTVVSLSSGEVAVDINFGNYRLFPVQICKYVDQTGNGLSDDDQLYTGEEGWLIKIFSGETQITSGSTIQGCTTLYVPAGQYRVSEATQSGWTPTATLLNGTTTSFTTDTFFDIFVDVTIATTSPTTTVTFYNHLESAEALCGNGVINEGEQCDGSAGVVDGFTCSASCQLQSTGGGGGAVTTTSSSGGGGGGGGGGGAGGSLLVIHSEMTQDPTANAITITWHTNLPATSRVVYETVSHPIVGFGPNYGYAFSNSEDPGLVTFHSMVITGLTPNTVYYFRPVSHNSAMEVHGIELIKPITSSGTVAGDEFEEPSGQPGGTGGTGGGNDSGGQQPSGTGGPEGIVAGVAYEEGTGVGGPIIPRSTSTSPTSTAVTTPTVASAATSPAQQCIVYIWILLILNLLVSAYLAYRERLIELLWRKHSWIAGGALTAIPVIIWYPVCWLWVYLLIILIAQGLYLVFVQDESPPEKKV